MIPQRVPLISTFLIALAAALTLRAQAQPLAPAAIAVTVRDIRGAAAPGVEIELISADNALDRTVTADDNGTYVFADLPAGTYRVKIKPPSVAPSVSEEIILASAERRELPMLALEAPSTTTTVKVTASIDEVAQEQVAQQEKQRALGILPNYYVSYIWDAAPLTRKLKFSLGFRSLIDPATFLVTAGIAGVEHAHKTFPGYGQEFEGYAKRYASAYGDTVTSLMVGNVILPTLFHQDPRYFYQGSGTVRSRILYAISSAFVCRDDNGRPQPNYSAVAGSFVASGLSNLYRSPGDRNASLTFRNGLIIIGSRAAANVMREFLSRKVTSNIPDYATGKP